MAYGEVHAPINDKAYPVINSNPSLGAIMRNVAFGDYFFTLFMTGVGGAFGFAGGKPIRRVGAWYMAGLSLFTVGVYSMRGSWQRLTGERPNPSECARAGIPYVAPDYTFA